jgi:hypothetical protein
MNGIESIQELLFVMLLHLYMNSLIIDQFSLYRHLDTIPDAVVELASYGDRRCLDGSRTETRRSIVDRPAK